MNPRHSDYDSDVLTTELARLFTNFGAKGLRRIQGVHDRFSMTLLYHADECRSLSMGKDSHPEIMHYHKKKTGEKKKEEQKRRTKDSKGKRR